VPYFNNDGTATTFANIIGVYETDGDLLWQSSPGVGQRGRTLVLRTIFTGLYSGWMMTWKFLQNGTIESSVNIIGKIVTQYTNDTKSELMRRQGFYGEYISDHLFALNHTRVVSYRFDFDIDGVENTVVENNWYDADTSCANGKK